MSVEDITKLIDGFLKKKDASDGAKGVFSQAVLALPNTGSEIIKTALCHLFNSYKNKNTATSESPTVSSNGSNDKGRNAASRVSMTKKGSNGIPLANDRNITSRESICFSDDKETYKRCLINASNALLAALPEESQGNVSGVAGTSINQENLDIVNAPKSPVKISTTSDKSANDVIVTALNAKVSDEVFASLLEKFDHEIDFKSCDHNNGGSILQRIMRLAGNNYEKSTRALLCSKTLSVEYVRGLITQYSYSTSSNLQILLSALQIIATLKDEKQTLLINLQSLEKAVEERNKQASNLQDEIKELQAQLCTLQEKQQAALSKKERELLDKVIAVNELSNKVKGLESNLKNMTEEESKSCRKPGDLTANCEKSIKQGVLWTITVCSALTLVATTIVTAAIAKEMVEQVHITPKPYAILALTSITMVSALATMAVSTYSLCFSPDSQIVNPNLQNCHQTGQSPIVR